jgi:neutral ceramidase
MLKSNLKILALIISSTIAIASNANPSNVNQIQLAKLEKNTKQLVVGASVKDITPQKNMLPLHRMPKVEITGVLDPIHVRVIALSSGGATSLMICSETGRSLGPQVAEAVSRHTGVPLESIINTATHSHAAPEWSDPINVDFQDGPDVSTQQKWAKYALDQTLAAADEALASMKPATVGIGYSKSYINVNRNAYYNKVDKSGKSTEYNFLGYNPEGPSDKTVAALQFNDLKGDPIAYIVNYSVHGTVMHGNTISNGKTGVSADIPGLVSDYLEEKHPGSVAMWLSGAAGDQNPIIQNNMYTRNPKTGEFEELFSNNYDMLTYLAKIHFHDVETALSSIHSYTRKADVNSAYMESPIPSNTGKGNAEISLQMLRIGDIAFAAFPGELFTSTGMTMKDKSLLKNTIIVNHAWQKISQSPNYHVDDDTLAKNGFGADRAYYKAGFLTPTLSSMTNRLIKETNQWTFNGDGTATNTKTGEMVIVGLDHEAGTADDNEIVSPSGKVILKNAHPMHDSNSKVYVDLGNGFRVYPGADNVIGTKDDVVINFGHYPQSDSSGAKADPIDWRILDIKDNVATLTSSVLLDAVKFNNNENDGNEWATSNLRLWLNSKGGKSSSGDTNGFYNSAFSPKEKSNILLTTVSMKSKNKFIAYDRLLSSDWWKYYSTNGENTQDYIWALSGEEVFNYFGKSSIATEKELGHSPDNYTAAYFAPSKFAHSNGVKVNTGGNGPSFVGYGDIWTRSKGADGDGKTYNGVFVGSTGSLNSGRSVTRDYGVLPVIRVRLK